MGFFLDATALSGTAYVGVDDYRLHRATCLETLESDLTQSIRLHNHRIERLIGLIVHGLQIRVRVREVW